MFYKVPIDLVTCHPTEGHKEYVKYGIGSGDKFEGIKYTDFDLMLSPDIHSFWNLIPTSCRKHFNISLMTINRDILPHTDSNTKTAINWYLDPSNYVTSFCTPLAHSQSFKLDTQTDGVVYAFEDVSMESSFVAEKNDVYVLDVTKLHCVHSGQGKRVALNLATNKSYDEVIDMLMVL